MKIAFVADAIWPYNKGGKEKRLYDISTRLAARGHHVHIYTMHWWKGPQSIQEDGVTLHAISPLYPLYSGTRRSIKQGIMFGAHCLKMIREDWDVIDVDHMPFFPLYSVRLVCWLKGKKMTATWNEVWGRKYWMDYMGQTGIIASIIERISVLLPDRIISISPHTTEALKKNFHISQPIATIGIGVDTEHIQSIKPAKEKSDIIYVGRLLSHKNVNVLLKAVALLAQKQPVIRCIIIGQGPEQQTLRKLTRDLRIEANVTFMHELEHIDDVYALMKSSKVFVLPSTREGFGIVVLEANACGLPVITTNHPDNAARHLIHGKNGHQITLSAKHIAEAVLADRSKQVEVEAKHSWKTIIDGFEKEIAR